MIRCVRLGTGQDDASHFQAGWLDMRPGDGLAADGAGNIYVSDVANESVRVLRPSGH